MNVTDPELIILKGVDHYCDNNNCHLFDSFIGSTEEVPNRDTYYVAMYKNQLLPDVIVSHIGVVDEISAHENGKDFYYKAIITLANPIIINQAIKKIEYWDVTDFGLDPGILKSLRDQLTLI